MKKKNNGGLIVFLIILGIIFLPRIFDSVNYPEDDDKPYKNDNTFRIIASSSTKMMDDKLIKYGKKKGIKVEIVHYGDLEIVDILNSDSTPYDAVWISNSLWLYNLNNSYLTTDSKSIVIDPVVMGITKSKAKELDLIGKDIRNKDILNAIRDGKLKYVMPSVTKTNTGATSYLSFLNSMLGSPEVITEDMLNDESLKNNLKDFFKGVERVSGDEEYLTEMYKNGNYDAMINYESSLIELNRELVKKGKEPLYLVYPVDGVAINDMPFAYISNDSTDEKNREKFLTLQSYLRSDEAIKLMQEYGYRSWYGGTNKNADKKIFNPDWGIDTSKYLKDMKYPSKKVITKAINLYIESFRKPTHVVFCLDVSGSMYGSGMQELKDAMNYILDKEQASKDNLQFSDKDKITIITFNSSVQKVFDTRLGSETNLAIKDVDSLYAQGGTNIYDPSIRALEILEKDDANEYTKTVILMTDGNSNVGSYYDLRRYYNNNKLDIPIYSITFGDSSEEELGEIARLTNAKVFDGKSGLLRAFTEVRSYN
ncbi:MAG: VWA domain-containing protein [Bacilli bacterium]|nr:VWA domain-containing protein [Bacilli bacterium]